MHQNNIIEMQSEIRTNNNGQSESEESAVDFGEDI